MSEEVLRRVKHSWNERDTVGYECPIKEFVNRTTTQVVEERGERIYQAVLDIGTHVDKEELLKALQYDRGQYEKGFRDGYRRARRWIPCSERMPEHYGDYLVTVIPKAGNLWSRMYIARYSDLMGICMQPFFYIGVVGKDGFEKLENVAAWMPLPEPYREDGDSDG